MLLDEGGAEFICVRTIWRPLLVSNRIVGYALCVHCVPSVFRRFSLMRFLLSGCVTGLLLLLSGCASQSNTDPRQIARRKVERAGAYAALAEEHKVLVDQGQLRVGMGEDAVYIAWGAPAQVLQSGDAAGEVTTWLFEGTTTDDYLSWNFREVTRRDGTTYLDRFLDRDINIRVYISAELSFRNGALASWKMLPRPPSNTILAPQPFLR